jgi:hypothetical protein
MIPVLPSFAIFAAFLCELRGQKLLEPFTAKHTKKIRKERKEMPTTHFFINVFINRFPQSTALALRSSRPFFAGFAVKSF